MAAERHGDAAEAERHYRAAVEAGQDERVREGRARAEARRGLARALRLQRRAVEAVAELEAALAVVRADPAARPEMPLLLAELGEAQAATGHLDAAIEAWRSACDEWREARGSAPPLSVVLKLAGALLERGGIEEAIRRLQSALDHPEEVSAPLAERMEAHRLLGWAWNRRGEPVLALRHAREAWRLATSAPAVSSAERAIVYADLAALHLAIGDAARAADFAQNAVAEWGRASLTNQESLAAAWVLLGEANNRLQRYLDAARAWSNAAVAVAGTGGDRRLQWVRTRTQETRAWVEAGVPGAAIAASDALAGVLESFGAELPPRLRAEAGLQRARALEAAGRSDEADRAYAQAMAALEDTVASSEEAVLRAEIAVRWAVLRTARGRLFGAQEALTAVRAVPDGLGRELTATARRLRAHLQEMMKPHGPITMPADIMAIQELEREYRARRPREAATEERAEAAQRSGP